MYLESGVDAGQGLGCGRGGDVLNGVGDQAAPLAEAEGLERLVCLRVVLSAAYLRARVQKEQFESQFVEYACVRV